MDNKFRLVDAPGYGYHKNSLEADRLFSKMMNEYIKERNNVEAFVLLVDSRHKLSEDDMEVTEAELSLCRKLSLFQN